uniref:UBA domain-containing protein n=1 Tax=Panagrolaimus superbus TaxID=310955 RepID=A0A914ZBD6_9BILA
MGLKTDSLPTNSRSKMNPRDLKIKQIVETTRCTHSEAEEALQENNNELEAAVSWILDHTGDNVWTESKTRKAKKTDVVVEEQRPERPPRGESGNRRGGKRGGGTTRVASNNWKPGQVFTRSEPPAKSTSPEDSNFFAPNSNNGSAVPNFL